MSKTTKRTERKYYNNPNDCGRHGRNTEVDNRLLITPGTKVLRCQDYTKLDHFIFIKTNERKEQVKIENKVRCGTVTDCYESPVFEEIDLHDRDALEQYILPKVDIVIYGPEVDNSNPDHMEDFYVFTREQFIDMLFDYDKPMLKRNNKNGNYCLNIQTFYNSKKRLNYVLNKCMDVLTYGEFLEEIGRRVTE